MHDSLPSTATDVGLVIFDEDETVCTAVVEDWTESHVTCGPAAVTFSILTVSLGTVVASGIVQVLLGTPAVSRCIG